MTLWALCIWTVVTHCLHCRLAFIPHFHLPHVDRLVHSERWRGAVSRSQWSKGDFLVAMLSREAAVRVHTEGC